MKTRFNGYQKGFTLIEIALIVVLISIIGVGAIAGINGLRESAKYSEDQLKMEDIKGALAKFAAINGYLPCPDTTDPSDPAHNPAEIGLENREPTGECTASSGSLPYINLSTHSNNAFGYLFRYHVNENVSNATNIHSSASSASYFASGLCTDPSSRNADQAPCFRMFTPPIITDEGEGNYLINDGSDVIAQHIPVVVVSPGKNDCPGEGDFEIQNCEPVLQHDNQLIIYQAPHNSGANPFDDVVIWLSALDIKMADVMLATDRYRENITVTDPDAASPVEIDDEVVLDGGNNDDIIERIWGNLAPTAFGVANASAIFNQPGVGNMVQSLALNVTNTTELVIQATGASGSPYLFGLGNQYRVTWRQDGELREMLAEVTRSDVVSPGTTSARDSVVLRGIVNGIETVLIIDDQGIRQNRFQRYAIDDSDSTITIGFEASQLSGRAPAGCTVIVRDKDGNALDTAQANSQGRWTAIVPNDPDLRPFRAELDEYSPCN